MIAISYRREDSTPITGRIYDRLQTIFGRERVFMDLDSIPFGVDFRTHIAESMNHCHTLLVVIGPQWLGASTDGTRRIDDPTDFVRLEVAQALARNIQVIPLLIDRTDMPSSSALPDDLKNLAFRNALRVDSGADFHHHMDRLCSSLQRVSGASDPQVTSPQPTNPLSSPPPPVAQVPPPDKDNSEQVEALIATLREGAFVLGSDSKPIQLQLHSSIWSMSAILKGAARLPENGLITTSLRPTFLVCHGELGIAAERYRIFSLDATKQDGEFEHIAADTVKFDSRRFSVTPTKELKPGRRYVIGFTSNWKDKAWGPIITQKGA